MNTNRREFLGGIALATSSIARGAQAGGAKLELGLIGCGWYGMVDLEAAFKVGGVECAGLCDVDSEHLAKAADQVAKWQPARPATFKHYKDLLDVAGLQAVIIATPPHWHALPFIECCRRSLDVYLEKPVAYDVREGYAMVEAARRSRGIIQVGFQRRQAEAIRQAARYIRDGNAGRIVQVDVQIHYAAGTPDPTPQNPPPSLDWELWCGPAPKLPYSPAIGHMSWRLEAAYGNGHLVDWGIHLIDAIRNTLGEKMPRAVTAAGGLYELKGKITTPDTLTAVFEFASCPVVWRHRVWGAAEYTPEVSNGIFFYGERETVFVTDDRWVVIPRGKGEHRVVEAQSDAGRLHMANFLECAATRKQPSCSVEDAWLSTATVQLGMIAYRAGGAIAWDAGSMQITNNPAGARLLLRPYRAPYIHPAA